MSGTINDSDKLDDLRKKLSKYANTINQLQSNIKSAKIKVGEEWKDIKFNDFNEAYASYEKDIKKFEEVLNEIVKETLPDRIAKLKAIENNNMKTT